MYKELFNTFNNVGKIWSDDDIELLKDNYTNNNLSVQKISIIHQRTMYSILYKLKELNIIENLENATGYNEYIELRYNDIENELLKIDYLKNNLSLEDLATKYDLSNVQVLKKLFKIDYLENNLSLEDLATKYKLSNVQVLKKLFKS